MPRPVGTPCERAAAAGILVAVLRRIPTIARHVDAAAEGNRIVDHNDLVVVRRPARMDAIQLEGDALMQGSLSHPKEGRTPPLGLHRAEVPLQDVDVKIRLGFDKPRQERP